MCGSALRVELRRSADVGVDVDRALPANEEETVARIPLDTKPSVTNTAPDTALELVEHKHTSAASAERERPERDDRELPLQLRIRSGEIDRFGVSGHAVAIRLTPRDHLLARHLPIEVLHQEDTLARRKILLLVALVRLPGAAIEQLGRPDESLAVKAVERRKDARRRDAVVVGRELTLDGGGHDSHNKTSEETLEPIRLLTSGEMHGKHRA